MAKYNLLHTDSQNTTGKILIGKTLQAKYFMGKILIGNILAGKVLGGNKRWAKYFVGNATGRQSTIDRRFITDETHLHKDGIKQMSIFLTT